MTNSTPKMSDKIERQGSPNAGGKRHSRNNSIKSSTYFSSSNRPSRNSNGRSSCSPPCPAKTRGSPLRQSQYESPRGSPTNNFYAGAKFSEPPSPASLPKPPSHWTTRLISTCKQAEHCCDISNHLKMILNVQA
ncbi:proline-rich nuclear receptor coactivator 2-like [Diprion similis]|uniref:proline-rich nuclear receptor coactivator 2-like n=1 Tax=Diprion similis TaxID=362088 RepID=UPI001EF9321B|nr:proline-rich nuclear receptor coactivator 2-like [Diprion similis]